MTDFVLDNSVTMRWCFECGSHLYADGVLQMLETRVADAFVPVLWRYEVSSVLVRAQKTGILSAAYAADFLEDLAALPIIVDADSARPILTDVYLLAVTYGLTSYDAAYLELALRRRLPLATLDAELVQACQAAGVAVL